MWLPKDERKVLIHYYKELHGIGLEKRGPFFLSDLEKCLSGKNKRNRVKTANTMLKQRKLLDFLNDQGDATTVQLSFEGHDLGRKYHSKHHTFLLWCDEYKLILTIIGLILTLLIVIFTGISAFKNK